MLVYRTLKLTFQGGKVIENGQDDQDQFLLFIKTNSRPSDVLYLRVMDAACLI